MFIKWSAVNNLKILNDLNTNSMNVNLLLMEIKFQNQLTKIMTK